MAHGSSHRPRRCVECNCDNGRISCTRQDPIHDCPKLNCPIEDQIHEEGECCKVCKGMLVNWWLPGRKASYIFAERTWWVTLLFFCLADFCSRGGHNCHPEATCRNGLYNYTCHCHQGFTGNGFHCEGKKCSLMQSLYLTILLNYT